MDLGFSGKTVVITGATANIGRAIALEMAKEGAKVLAVGRDRDAGARVVSDAKARGAAAAEFVAVDLLDADAGETIRQATAKVFGPVDVLVNNVGGNFTIGAFAESDPEMWIKDIDITFMSVLRVTRAILPDMIARKCGNIVNMGSTAGLVGDSLLSVYSASKGAVHSFTKVLAKEVGRHNVRVNCVVPYATLPTTASDFSKGSRFHPETGFFTKALAGIEPADLKQMERHGPLARNIARAEEIAAAVLYVASDRAGFVTGQLLTVDGGTLL
jgi:NAD(P)-dependent dehydrogenase (short-subunit alcohol dehydrogenase family)